MHWTSRHPLLTGSLLALAGALVGCPGPSLPPGAASAPSEAALHELNVGVRRLEQFRYAEAVERFESALALHPDWLPARVDLAIAHLNDVLVEGHAERAVAAADQALQLDPEHPRALYVKGYALVEQLRRPTEALPVLERLVEIEPADPHAHYLLGAASRQREPSSDEEAGALTAAAEAAWRRALELHPTFSEANYKLARLLVESEDEARQDEGMSLLERHQDLLRGRPPVQQNYLTRGALALVEPFLPPAPRPERPDSVRFADASLAATGAGAGGELLIADVDDDGRLDLTAIGSAGASWWPQPVAGQLGEPGALALGPGTALAAGDFDRDGRLELAAATGSGVAVQSGAPAAALQPAALQPAALQPAALQPAALQPAVAGSSGVTPEALTVVDLDHDGDLDLIGATTAGRLVLRNDGSAAFADASSDLGLAAAGGRDGAWFDLDGDNAVDLVAAGADGATLWLNDRDGPFRPWPLGELVPEAGAGIQPVGLDFDRDGDLDLALLVGERVVLLENRSRPGAPALALAHEAELPGAAALRVGDLDLDGHRELLAFGAAGPVAVWEGLGDGTSWLVVRRIGWEGADLDSVAVADLDGDGDLDLAARRADAAELLLRWNEQTGGTFLRLDLQGREQRSNPSGLGAKLVLDAGSLRQHREHAQAQGAMANVLAPATFGLGGRQVADGLGVLWPSGIRQAETELAAGAEHAIVELDRQPSSCPMLYAWDGQAWSFLTDCYDTAPLGLWVAPGTHVAGDPDELYRLRAGQVALRDGVVNLLVAEFLNESLLADRASLLALDVEPGRSVVVDEGVRLAAPPPERAVWSVGPGEPPRSARLLGRDVTAALTVEDRDVAGWERATPFLGLAEPFWLEIDLAESAGLLVVSGSLNFSNSTNLFAAHQAGLGPRPRALEVQTPAGWRELSPDAGTPAGFHKDVVVDLRSFGLRGPATVRLSTNLQVSWDRIALHRDARPVEPAALRPVPTLRAEKRWLGIPREVQGPENRWRSFPIDAELVGVSDWVHQSGPETSDGDVRHLVARDDGRLAILRPGEALELGFDAGALPAPRPGWSRTFVLSTRGWVKDADPHTAASSSVLPFPEPGRPLYP